MIKHYSRLVEEQIDHVNVPTSLAFTLILNNVSFIAEPKDGVWEFTVRARDKRVLDISIRQIEVSGKNEILYQNY